MFLYLKVKELRLWANNKDDLHEKLCTFNEIAMGGFFDIVCQVNFFNSALF
jgi:hypothetical protein